MPTPILSAARLTTETQALIARLVKMLDPDYPSVIVPNGVGGIDEDVARYENSRPLPSIIAEDNRGWGGNLE